MSKKKVSALVVCVVVLLAIAVVSGVSWWFYKNTKPVVSTNAIQSDSETAQSKIDETISDNTAEKVVFDKDALQAVLTEWQKSIPASATASVVVADDNGTVLASVNGDEQYFTASLYKLFVAYEGYKALDAGDLSADDAFQGSRTVAECLDLMIRESDSPCGERMWTELGKQTIDSAITAYGITSTDMVGLQTTAKDTATMLARIARGEGLTDGSQATYLDSMKTQPALYRRGLPSGLSEAVTVYNKVGWNEQLEWHDAAIVERTDGEQLIVAVLTSRVGSAMIAELGRAIETTL